LVRGRQLDLDPDVGAPLERAQEVHDFDRPFAIAEFDRGYVDEVVEFLARRLLEPLHRCEQPVARDVHNPLTVTRYCFSYGAGNHEERNWWTELPNGSEISSIVSGGRRRPLSSSGCSSRRRTASNNDSPLIFLWSRRIPYSSPSGRGGQPGT